LAKRRFAPVVEKEAGRMKRKKKEKKDVSLPGYAGKRGV